MPNRIDRNSRAYKIELAVVAVMVTVLTLLGGWLLGRKIRSAEQAKHSGQMQEYYEAKKGKTPGPEHGIIQ